MKTHLYLLIILLLISACSSTTITSSSFPPTQIQPGHPASSPTPIIESEILPSVLPTIDTGLTSINSCTPALIPAVFFPDGERLLGFRDIRIQIYNLKTHIIEVQIQLPTDILKAALSPDGQTLAVGLDDFSIQIIRLADQKVVQILNSDTGIISGLAFSPTGDRILSASEDTWIHIWSLDGQELDTFQPTGADDLPSSVMGIGLSSDWKKLATIPFDGLMNLWSLPDHKLLSSFEGSIHGGYSGSQAAFSPDGQYLAQHLGAGGGYFSLWRITDKKLLLRGENITTGIDFSSDGRFLAYGEMLPTGGGHVVIRTPDGSQIFHELIGPAGSLPANPLFTPDGNELVTTDYASGALLAWSTADGEQISLGENACPDR
jgi:WD40 repeat protein